MYRAPVDEIAFTLKHVAGLKPALDSATVRRPLGGPGRRDPCRSGPLRHRGSGAALQDRRRAWRRAEGRRGHHAARLEGALPPLDRRRLERAVRARTTMAARACRSCSASRRWKCGTPAPMAFGIGPTLTMGAVEAIDKHASDALKSTYLAKLVSGEWMGTMNLTEPQAGSDLNALKSRAEPAGDGTYRIFGTEDLHHLWRARFHRQHRPSRAGAAAGRAAPARAASRCSWCRNSWSNADGSLGARNDVFCGGIEHKLGIHGSPTCTMIYGDGFVKDRGAGRDRLADRRGKSRPRLHVHHDEQCPPCRRHAGRGGRRSRDPEGASPLPMSAGRARLPSYAGEGMAPIVHHPDVQRDLLTMKALTRCARDQLCLRPRHRHGACRATATRARHWQERANLLTPIAKVVRDRYRRRGRLARRAGAWRHGLHRGDGRGELLSRRPHRADL